MGSGARVMLLDRYEIGEKQTSACAAPTDFLENLGLAGAIRQTFSDLVIHRRRALGGPDTMKTYRWNLPWSFSTFDYREICGLLKEQSPDIPSETAKVAGRTGENDPHRPWRSHRTPDHRRPRLAELPQRVRSGVTRRTHVCPAASRSIPTGRTATSNCGWTRSRSAPATHGTFRLATSCASASGRSIHTTTSRIRPRNSRPTSGFRPSAGRATGSAQDARAHRRNRVLRRR